MPEEKKALISRIQHFSTADGPGIRTTVFFQGCTMRCDWCHNPETQSGAPVMIFYKNACLNCGVCAAACRNGAHFFEDGKHVFLREKCVFCGKCEKACPANALAISGRIMTVREVFDECMEDAELYGKDGGVTLSGGEPALWPGFIAALGAKLHEAGIKVILDTAGNVPLSNFLELKGAADTYYYDLKAANAEDCKKWCGGDLDLVLGNLKALAAEGCDIRIRIPVIPGYNGDGEYIEKIMKLAEDICGKKLPADRLPFHRYGFAKYDGLDMINKCAERRDSDG